MATTQNLLISSEVAALLHVSRQRVWQMARDGEVPAIRLGRDLRFDPADVERYIDSHRTGSRDGD